MNHKMNIHVIHYCLWILLENHSVTKHIYIKVFSKKNKKETSFQFYERPFDNMVFVILVIYQNTFKYMYISMH